MKKTICMLLVLALCLSMVNITALAERKYEADFSILGTAVDFKNPAYSSYDAVYVPLEELSEYLELGFSKNEDIYTVTRGEEKAQVQLGNLVIKSGEQEVKMTVSPEEYNGVVYVPAEFFAKAFGMEVVTSSDKRRVDINPNVYVLNIDINNAAAVSAAKPDTNTISKSTSGTDPLYKNDSFPAFEKDIYYMVDLSGFAGQEIENAKLMLKAKRGEYNPTLAVLRTAPWDAETICFNNRPQEYGDAAATSIAKETGVQPHTLDITEFVRNAQTSGEKLSLKLEGRPHSARTTTSTVKYDVQGVNTKNSPYVTVVIKKNYNFPIKTVVEAKEDNTYDELMLLYSLGIFTEDDELPLDMNDSVQRQEFVKYALRLRNTSSNAGSGAQFFADVPVDAPFYNDVMTAHSLGLVSGWEGIEFRPYDRITTGEAITILGRMLNYNIYADERGGFTPGYFAAARQGDLYMGSASEKSELSFNKMISLFEDALDAKMLNVRSYRPDGTAEYTFDESMTILSEYWNAKKIEGIVTANEYGNIVPGASGKDGKIVIGSKELTLGYEPYNDFLGYKVRGWYNDENEVLYIGILNATTTKIDIADLENVTDSDSTVSLSYIKENGKRISKSFSKDATVIYNGKSISRENVTTALFDADNGSITLVGNDLVVIDAYATVVVYGVDSDEEEIYDLYEEYDKTLRLADADYSFVNTDGKEISIEGISPKSVLSVAKSLDGKYVRGIVSADKVDGTVELIEDIGTEDMKLTVGGHEYCVTNLHQEWEEHIKLGARGVFYIDAFGNIAGFDREKTTQIFGYLLDVDRGGKSALSEKTEAAIMTRGSEDYIVYQFADSVKIDGDKKKTTDEIKAAFNSSEGTFETQGIVFDINQSGEIISVDTYYKEDQEAEEDPENTLQRRRTAADGSIRYKSTGAVGGKYFINTAQTLAVRKTGETGSLDDYETVSGNFSNDTSYPFELYTIGTYNPEVAVVMVEGTTASSPGTKDRLMLADKVVTAFDSDGYEIKKLYYYDGQTRKSIIVPDENLSLVSDLGRGDIIRFAADVKGELSAITIYYDFSTKTFKESVLTNLNSFNAGNRTFGGYAERINGKYVMVSSSDVAGDTSAKYTWMNSNSFINSFYKYEATSTGVDVMKATLADIKTTTNVPFAPNGMIFHDHWASLRANVWLLEVNQPENTGIYKLTYSSGVTDGSVTTVLPEPIRYNPGDLAPVTDIVPSRRDHDFMGWAVKGTTQPLYKHGDDIVVNGDTELVAQWYENPTYAFEFKDPDNDLTTLVKEWSILDVNQNPVERTLPTAEEFTKDGSILIGWKSDSDAEVYAPGSAYTPSAQESFTAVWMKNWSGAVAAEAPELSGDYYLIENGEDLAWFSEQVKTTPSIKAKLVNDIYLNNFIDCGDGKQINETVKNWFDNSELVTAANDWTAYTIDGFTGEFDGNNKTIYGAYMKGGNGTGFFSSIAGGTVKNLTIKDAYLVSTANPWKSSTSTEVHAHPVGILAGLTSGSASITGVTTSGKLIADADKTAHCAGGIVGKAKDATLENCISHVVIDTRGGNTKQMTAGNVGVGGIVGIAHEGTSVTLKNCVNYGNIYAPYSRNIGGVMGWAYMKVTFDNCGNAGHIRGSEAASSRVKEICGYTSSGKGTTGSSSDSLTAGSAKAYDATEGELPTVTE